MKPRRAVLTFALLTLAATLLLLRHDAAAESRPAPAAPVSTAAAAPADAIATGPPAAATAPPDRQTVAPPPGAEPAAKRTFAQYVDELVRIGVTTAVDVEAGRLDEARASDAAARALMESLFADCPDCEHAALAELLAADPPPDDGPHPQRVRRRVLHLVLDTGLHRLHARTTSGGSREAIDALVAAALTGLPASEAIAVDVAGRQLVDRPWLGSAHEDQVLELVTMGEQGRFPAALATALLTTLWHNLEAAGERSSDELAALALLFLGETNPSKRAAACRLLIADARYRAIVLDTLRRSGDEQLAREIAMAAANGLAADDALEVLAVAAPLAPRFVSPFLTLAMRDPGALRQAYERRLAGASDPALREQLIAGLGFSGTPIGIELAQLAFESDPTPAVRLRALFVLTGAATDAAGEGAFRRALADPALRDDPANVGALVLALENFALAERPNVVDRLGRELLAVVRLTPEQRAEVDRILARALPQPTTR